MFIEKVRSTVKSIADAICLYRFEICIYLGLFIILYFPPIFSIGAFHLNAVHIVGFGSIAYLLYGFRFMKYIRKKENIWIIAGFLFLLFYGIVLFLVHGTALSNMTSQLYYVVDVLPFAFVVAAYGEKKQFRLLNYINMFIAVGTAQAIIGLLTMVIPPLKQLFVDMLVEFGYGDVVTRIPHRLFGFSGQLTFATPIVQSILSVICFYLCFTKSQGYYIPMVLMMSTAIINARTSIISFGIGVLVVLCCSRQWGYKRTLHTLRVPLYCIPILLVGMVVMYFTMPATIKWIVEGIGEIFSLLLGNSDTPTFNYLLDPKWRRLPEGSSLFLGVGSQIMYGYENLAAGIERVNSDIGYINDIWYGGLIYAVAQYAFFYFLFSRLMKCHSKILRCICVYLMLVMPILNIKGIAFSMSGFTNLIVILIIAMINMTPREEQKGITK